MAFFTKLVGVTYDNPDGVNRQNVIATLQESSSIHLERDYANLYDPNAIMVMNTQEQQLGFVSKDIALKLAQKMDSGKQIIVRIARLTGGGDYTRGVNIQIDD